jgi:hypothetical protein
MCPKKKSKKVLTRSSLEHPIQGRTLYPLDLAEQNVAYRRILGVLIEDSYAYCWPMQNMQPFQITFDKYSTMENAIDYSASIVPRSESVGRFICVAEKQNLTLSSERVSSIPVARRSHRDGGCA